MAMEEAEQICGGSGRPHPPSPAHVQIRNGEQSDEAIDNVDRVYEMTDISTIEGSIPQDTVNADSPDEQGPALIPGLGGPPQLVRQRTEDYGLCLYIQALDQLLDMEDVVSEDLLEAGIEMRVAGRCVLSVDLMAYGLQYLPFGPTYFGLSRQDLFSHHSSFCSLGDNCRLFHSVRSAQLNGANGSWTGSDDVYPQVWYSYAPRSATHKRRYQLQDIDIDTVVDLSGAARDAVDVIVSQFKAGHWVAAGSKSHPNVYAQLRSDALASGKVIVIEAVTRGGTTDTTKAKEKMRSKTSVETPQPTRVCSESPVEQEVSELGGVDKGPGGAPLESSTQPGPMQDRGDDLLRECKEDLQRRQAGNPYRTSDEDLLLFFGGGELPPPATPPKEEVLAQNLLKSHSIHPLYERATFGRLLDPDWSLVNPFTSMEANFHFWRGLILKKHVVIPPEMNKAWEELEMRDFSERAVCSFMTIVRLHGVEKAGWLESGEIGTVACQHSQFRQHLNYLRGIRTTSLASGCLNCRALGHILSVFAGFMMILVVSGCRFVTTIGSRALTRLHVPFCEVTSVDLPLDYTGARTLLRRQGTARLVARLLCIVLLGIIWTVIMLSYL